MQINFDNIKGGPKTTILGVVLITFSLYMMNNAIDYLDYILDGGVLATGITCFLLSDKIRKKDEKD